MMLAAAGMAVAPVTANAAGLQRERSRRLAPAAQLFPG
jgi:hypothetical protein